MSESRCRTIIFYVCVVALLGLSCQQLLITFMEWEDRPFDQFPVEVSKQDLPFPSVTICPEGFTLWAGIRSLLNDFNFTRDLRSKLPNTFTQFIEQKLALVEYWELEESMENCMEEDTVNRSRY